VGASPRNTDRNDLRSRVAATEVRTQTLFRRYAALLCRLPKLRGLAPTAKLFRRDAAGFFRYRNRKPSKSSPNVSLIKFNFVPPQQSPKLFLEAQPLMMTLLILDVFRTLGTCDLLTLNAA